MDCHFLHQEIVQPSDQTQVSCISCTGRRILYHWQRKVKWKWKCLSHVGLFVAPWTWNSPGQNTGLHSLSLLQGIFPTQGSNPGLLHCRWILYQLSHNDHWTTWESPIRTIHPNRKALIKLQQRWKTCRGLEKTLSQNWKSERREGKQSCILLQALPLWIHAIGLFTTWLLTTSCLVKLLPMVLWPTLSHPFKMCYLDDYPFFIIISATVEDDLRIHRDKF